MDIHIQQRDAITVISVVDALDAHTAPELTAALDEQVAAGQRQLVLDLSRLTYSSSAGIRVILKVLKDLNSLEGRLCLAGIQDDVYRTFDITGLFTVIAHYPDVDSAIKHWE